MDLDEDDKTLSIYIQNKRLTMVCGAQSTV